MQVPRMMAGQAARISRRLGHNRPIAEICRSASFCSRFRKISARPNSPIATVTKSMPSKSSETPNVKRTVPLVTSVPTRPNDRPSKIIANALVTEPCKPGRRPRRDRTASVRNTPATGMSATPGPASARMPR